MQCPACNHEAASAVFGEPAKCPECGVYYHKALANKQRIEQARIAKLEPVSPAKAQPALTVAPPPKRLGYMYCQACGDTSSGKSHTKGSIIIELFLWLCLLLPGLIYSIWRLSSRQRVCPTCNNPGLIPTNSPKAKRELGIG